MNEESKKATHEELCDQALDHYMEISNGATHFNSVVPQAIEFYKKNGAVSETQAESSAINKFN